MVGPLYIGFLLVNDLFLLIFLLIIFFIFNTSHVLESTAFNFVKNNLSFSIFSFSVWIMQPLNTSKEEKRSNNSKKSNLYEFYIFCTTEILLLGGVLILSYLISVKTWLYWTKSQMIAFAISIDFKASFYALWISADPCMGLHELPSESLSRRAKPWGRETRLAIHGDTHCAVVPR